MRLVSQVNTMLDDVAHCISTFEFILSFHRLILMGTYMNIYGVG